MGDQTPFLRRSFSHGDSYNNHNVSLDNAVFVFFSGVRKSPPFFIAISGKQVIWFLVAQKMLSVDEVGHELKENRSVSSNDHNDGLTPLWTSEKSDAQTFKGHQILAAHQAFPRHRVDY